MELDRKNGVPYYIQLKDQIRRYITSGQWPTGTKLPTERELAESLGVSRNTVSQAYKELENEGVLNSTQGRGTFVADSVVVSQQENRKEKILRIIDVAMEEAVSLGFSIDDFVSFVHVRGMEKKAMLARIKVAFIECSPEQLAEANWNLGPGVTLIPLLLADLRDRRGREKMKAMQIAVTSEQHLVEVKTLFSGLDIPVLGLSLQAKLETMVRIAKLPAEREIALVTESAQFAEKVVAVLGRAGLYPNLRILVKPTPEVLTKSLPECTAVITARSQSLLVEKYLPSNMELIEFSFEPDLGSLNHLRSYMMDLKFKHDST